MRYGWPLPGEGSCFDGTGNHCCFRLRLSHKSRALERATTAIADATPTHTAARRITVGGAAVGWTNRQRTAAVADLCDSHA